MKKTIMEWSQEFGVIVHDPDGFDRKDANLHVKLFTEDEFRAGLLRSTIEPLAKGKYVEELEAVFARIKAEQDRKDLAEQRRIEADEKKHAEEVERLIRLTAQRNNVLLQLASLNGKTIKEVNVTEWSGHDAWNIDNLEIVCEDKSYMTIRLEDENTSCSCHPEYDYYLEVDIYEEPKEDL